MDPTTGIGAAEQLTRREQLLEQLRGQELSGFALFGDDYIRYFTGFNFLATERPVAVVGNTSGDLAAFVPEFEVERVRAETAFELVESYPEYPGVEHPLRLLAERAQHPGQEDQVFRRQVRMRHPVQSGGAVVVVATGRQDDLAVGAERYRSCHPPLSPGRGERLARIVVPQVRCPEQTSRDHAPAVRAERGTPYSTGVAQGWGNGFARLSVPHPSGPVGAGEDDALAVRAERRVVHRAAVLQLRD